MDIVDFQEKMDPYHRALFFRMLKTEQLPECLLKEYLKVKKMVDLLDGHLGIGELALISIMAGYNPETGKFFALAETTEGIDARLQAEADELAKPPALDESDDNVIEEAVEPPVGPPVEQPVEPPVSGATGQAAEKPDEGKAMLWSPGMPVNVLQEDELKKGNIFAVHPGDGNESVQLTVQLEGGETVTVNEDEVEAD